MASDGVNTTRTEQEKGGVSEMEEEGITGSKCSAASSSADGEQCETSSAEKRTPLPMLVAIEGKRYGSDGILYDSELSA